jgi:SAM-dependent methyltransferase
LRRIVGPWLDRSRHFNRSYHKPHGYAGDYRMVEWMYDLEGDPCADPTQPAIVNCLDYVFATVHSVRGVWERRHNFARLLAEEHRRHGRLRLLDVACGGARYTRDFLEGLPDAGDVEVTLVDQDPAALAFCRTVSLAPWADRLTTLSLPVTRLAEAVPAGAFDVVLSAGLFDYLDDGPARALLAHMAALTAPGGLTVVANFHPGDPSRAVKDWLVDWPLVFRDEAALASLFPDPARVVTDRPGGGTLVYGTARQPGA